jgi:hypothetical protein
MKMHLLHAAALATLLLVVLSVEKAQAQLNTVFSSVFHTILTDRLILSPGTHANHFVDAAARAESLLVPALNGLIVGNISSFPLSSTTPGVSFDFSGGQLVSVQEAAGPIFADRATTIGKGRINFGFNATFLDMSRVRGVETEKMRFTFTHEDLDGDGTLGGPDAQTATEADVIDVTMGMNLTAKIFAFYGAWGITKNLDVGVAIPLISVHMHGTAEAVINSFTYANVGSASHFFGGTATSPALVTTVPYDESATGIGDVVVRLKYSFLRGDAVDLGALANVSIPTGREEDFLGSGETNAIFALLASKKIGDFTPHLNLGYELRAAEFQSDRMIVRAGFDQRVLQGLTFAADFLGTFDLNESEAVKLYPGSITVVEYGQSGGTVRRTVSLSNVPDRDNDNLHNLSVGFKYSPSQAFLVLANILVPLNEAGLRASVAPTVGVSMNF